MLLLFHLNYYNWSVRLILYSEFLLTIVIFQSSVTWTSQVFRWLYSDLVIVNELLMSWVIAINDTLRKSVEEVSLIRRMVKWHQTARSFDIIHCPGSDVMAEPDLVFIGRALTFVLGPPRHSTWNRCSAAWVPALSPSPANWELAQA